MFKYFSAIARAFSPTPRFSDVALSDMTDAQLRRTGMTKAGILHTTFSGYYFS